MNLILTRSASHSVRILNADGAAVWSGTYGGRPESAILKALVACAGLNPETPVKTAELTDGAGMTTVHNLP